MKIAILWSHLSGYLNACMRTLVDDYRAELMVWHRRRSGDAPFADDQFAWLHNRHEYDPVPSGDAVVASLRSFRPDGVLVTSWHIPAYRAACRELANRAVRVCCMDNQWHWTLKQAAGATVAPWYVQPLYDAAFLPGRRQTRFARILGFDGSRIATGLYSCDHFAFSQARERRMRHDGQICNRFLFAGRLCDEKGVATLLAAYRIYRESSDVPWPLSVIGTGPLRSLVQAQPDVEYLGFVQPEELPDQLARSGCVILPSRFEPWGVIIHEATAAGIAVICSRACGASDHLVMHGENGFVLSRNSPSELASRMNQISSMTPERLEAMGRRSFELSWQFTPRKWAAAAVNLIDRARPGDATGRQSVQLEPSADGSYAH